MNIVIFGSRNINNYNLIVDYINSLDLNITSIISGGARGIDSLAIKYAKQNNIQLHIYNADWDRYGKSAGYIRNKEMFVVSDIGICFWDSQSKGTKHMIDLFAKHNKKLYLKIIDNNE